MNLESVRLFKLFSRLSSAVLTMNQFTTYSGVTIKDNYFSYNTFVSKLDNTISHLRISVLGSAIEGGEVKLLTGEDLLYLSQKKIVADFEHKEYIDFKVDNISVDEFVDVINHISSSNKNIIKSSESTNKYLLLLTATDFSDVFNGPGVRHLNQINKFELLHSMQFQTHDLKIISFLISEKEIWINPTFLTYSCYGALKSSKVVDRINMIPGIYLKLNEHMKRDRISCTRTNPRDDVMRLKKAWDCLYQR